MPCTWAGQHTMILRCTVWCFRKHSDVDQILDRKIILRWSCSDVFEKRAGHCVYVTGVCWDHPFRGPARGSAALQAAAELNLWSTPLIMSV